MSRLNERYRALREQPVEPRFDMQFWVVEAHRLQADAVQQAFGKLFASLGPRGFLTRGLRSLRRSLTRRRTLSELHRLDDRLLADIGLRRGELAHGVMSAELSDRWSAPAKPAVWRRVWRSLQAWQERRATTWALARLSDRQLRDIGIDRGAIAAIAGGAALQAQRRVLGLTPPAPAGSSAIQGPRAELALPGGEGRRAA